MTRRLSYPLAVALAAGLVLQLAFAFGPDPGIGPAASGLPYVAPSFSMALDTFAHNIVVVGLLALGALATGSIARSRNNQAPRRRMLLYAGLLAVAYWLYFVTGVDWLASDVGMSRPALMLRLVHGYLEWPALLLPWAGVAFAVSPKRRIDLRLVAAACACSVGLLVASALLEALVVPDLLGSGGA